MPNLRTVIIIDDMGTAVEPFRHGSVSRICWPICDSLERPIRSSLAE